MKADIVCTDVSALWALVQSYFGASEEENLSIAFSDSQTVEGK